MLSAHGPKADLVTVRHVVTLYLQGETLLEIAGAPNLSEAQVFHALSYFSDHRDENTALIAEESTDLVVLFHGTDMASANDILQYGVNAAKAAAYNTTGEFWATTDPAAAEWFGRANLANGPPARLRFEISEAILQSLLAQRPVLARTDGRGTYEFLPACFSALNQHMTGTQVAAIV